MKRSLAIMMAVSLMLGAAGCSSTQKIAATRGEVSGGKAYDSLGSVEVSLKAPCIPYRRMFGQLWEWMTFGHCHNISREDYLRGLLDKKLINAAKKGREAEEVIHVTYWPDLTTKKFPKGLVYAKGEMIRYKRFAS
ncbi:MAG TPA: hypothetical protein PLL75_07860 [Candidatus Omnitrophota bacterium]|nr:hypothetical protein [Candidatus Omnitrophota bacterium]HPS37621.1 hypothetical protein [Candidatus Omnitrophota bacterium]